MMRTRRVAATAALVVLMGTLTSCFAVDVTRAGVPQPPTVLRLGVAEAAGAMPDQIAKVFTRALEEDGDLEIEFWRQPDENSRWNQELATRLIDGELDLAIVAAPAWDALGVSTLSAMFLPFAVTTDGLLDALAESDIADDMLAGLAPLGVEGLGLVPAGFRHLFSPADDVVDPTDPGDTTVRVAYSETVWSYYEHVGAKPIDPNGHRVDELADDGLIDAFDSMFPIADGFLDAPATAGDVTVHPHAFVVVANSAAMDRLSDRQREALTDAASAAVRWSVAHRPRDAEAAADLCRRAPGARVFLAGPEAVAALREASRPVVDAALDDPEVAAVAERIASLATRVGDAGAPVEPCVGAPLSEADTAPPNVPAEFPDGEYRREVTEEALLAAGVDVSTAANHAGVWHLILEDGVVVDPNCVGSTYEVIDDRLVVRFGEGKGCGSAAHSVFFSAGWRLDGDQLTFTAVESGHGSDVLIREAIGGGPWTKIR